MVLFLFWVSLFLIFYAYLGYPLVLLFISRFWKRESSNVFSDELPRVSLLISAYNEEKVIADKIENSLALDYPKELLEIVMISDGSDDRTEEIVSKYADRGIILRSYPGRIGKTACLNKAVLLAKGDIIVFSDANSNYDGNAIRELVKHFSDKEIGFVTGHTRYVSDRDNKDILPIGIYSRIETLTKRMESQIGSCVGADGAIFAIRKLLYRPLDDQDINDFVIPLQIIKQGFKGVIEEKAFCVEEAAKETKGEYDRQVRITNRTIRAIFKNAEMLNPFKYGFFSFQLFSHKITKLLAPIFALTALVTNLLALSHGVFYVVVFLSQTIFYALSCLGEIRRYPAILSQVVSISKTFTIVNLAILCGWFKFLSGDTPVTWTTRRR